MNRTAICAVALILAGCMKNPVKTPDKPVGSYQMLPASTDNKSVYVLDTRDGRVAICTQTAPPQEMNCGVPHPQHR